LQVTPALIGLAGVLIGAVVTSGIAYLGDQHRRHDEKRAAIRLVSAEIVRNEISLANFVSHGRAPSPPLSTGMWTQQEGTLARYATATQWDDLVAFYILVENVRSRFVGGECLNSQARHLGVEGIDIAKNTLRDLGRRPFDPYIAPRVHC
jgi:hypothetical protein